VPLPHVLMTLIYEFELITVSVTLPVSVVSVLLAMEQTCACLLALIASAELHPLLEKG